MSVHPRWLFLAPLLAVLLAAAAGHAQDLKIPDAHYPALPETAAGPEGFAPPGWIIESKVEADLNGDGVPDLVVVLRDTSRANIVANPDGLGEKSLDTNPRMLVVAFAVPGRKPPGYRQVLVDHTLIPRWTNPVLEDPFGEITAARSAFSVRLTFFAFAGAWEATSNNLTFRYQNGGFELIGADRQTTHRASGEMRGVSANYSTGYKTLTSGTIASDVVKSTRRRLDKPRRLRLDQLGDGLAFEPR